MYLQKSGLSFLGRKLLDKKVFNKATTTSKSPLSSKGRVTPPTPVFYTLHPTHLVVRSRRNKQLNLRVALLSESMTIF